jgi:hypothetical protein
MRYLIALVLAGPALAEPTPPSLQAPTFQDPVEVMEYGVFCDTSRGETIDAPGTQLGYIKVPPDGLRISIPSQSLPADIGLAFGVFASTTRDVDATLMVHRPDLPEPETWSSFFPAEVSTPNYFAFEWPDEQVPGLWAIEAWEGEQLLFRVEYLVTPAGSDATLFGMCELLS